MLYLRCFESEADYELAKGGGLVTPNACLIEDKKVVFQKEEKKEEFKFPLYINTEIINVDEENGWVECIYDNQEIVSKLKEWCLENMIKDEELSFSYIIPEFILSNNKIYVDNVLITSIHIDFFDDYYFDLMSTDYSTCSLPFNVTFDDGCEMSTCDGDDYLIRLYWIDNSSSTYSLRNQSPTREEILQRRQEIIQKYLESKK